MKPSEFRKRYEETIRNKEYFNAEELAFYLGCSKRKIYYLQKYNGLPKHFGAGTGTNTRYIKREIDEWVRKTGYLFR
jgi:predicted DNA-binding transcriptional regulator AlpA